MGEGAHRQTDRQTDVEPSCTLYIGRWEWRELEGEDSKKKGKVIGHLKIVKDES